MSILAVWVCGGLLNSRWAMSTGWEKLGAMCAVKFLNQESAVLEVQGETGLVALRSEHVGRSSLCASVLLERIEEQWRE